MKITCSVSLLALVYTTICSTALSQNKAIVPPKIITHPPREIAYKSAEKVELPCEASGDPAPEYQWTRNGFLVRLDGDVEILPGVGTIVVLYPNPRHEGVYQCTATNEFGTAVSATTVLKMAVMDPFATTVVVPTHTPLVGMPLTLKCASPYSYPKGSITWALVDSNQDIDKSLPYYSKGSEPLFQPIATDARVAVDYSGSLHFANVVAEDAHNGQMYGCVLYNSKFRGNVQGDDQIISPVAQQGICTVLLSGHAHFLAATFAEWATVCFAAAFAVVFSTGTFLV